MLKYIFTIGLALALTFSVQAHERQKAKPQGVLSVDIQQQGDTVHLLLGKQQGDDKSFWYQASLDQGQTWSQPVLIKDKVKAKFSRGNDARLAVSGDTLVAVWMSWKDNVRFNAGPMQMARSSDGGQTWQLIDSAADWDGAHGFFAMAGNADAMSLVWLDNRDKAKGYQGLRYSSSNNGGQTWQADQTLDSKTCSCCWNTAKYAANGDLFVLYRDKKPSDMAMMKVTPEQQFERLSTVGDFNWDFAGCPHIGGGIAFDQQQNIHTVVGTAHEQHAGVHYQFSQDGGVTWSASQRMGDESAVHSDIGVTTNNHLIASWDNLTEHGLQVVYASKPLTASEWSKPKTISSANISGTHPRVIAFEDSALIVWTEKGQSGESMLNTQTVTFTTQKDNDKQHIHAFDKGSFDEIQQANLGQPHIVLFWAESCAFCMKEMAMLGKLLINGRQFKVTTIGTDFGLDDQMIETLHRLKGLADIDKWIFANPVVESLYFDVDKRWRGELPLTFLFDSEGNDIKHRGALSEQQVLAWLELVSVN